MDVQGQPTPVPDLAAAARGAVVRAGGGRRRRRPHPWRPTDNGPSGRRGPPSPPPSPSPRRRSPPPVAWSEAGRQAGPARVHVVFRVVPGAVTGRTRHLDGRLPPPPPFADDPPPPPSPRPSPLAVPCRQRGVRLSEQACPPSRRRDPESSGPSAPSHRQGATAAPIAPPPPADSGERASAAPPLRPLPAQRPRRPQSQPPSPPPPLPNPPVQSSLTVPAAMLRQRQHGGGGEHGGRGGERAMSAPSTRNPPAAMLRQRRAGRRTPAFQSRAPLRGDFRAHSRAPRRPAGPELARPPPPQQQQQQVSGRETLGAPNPRGAARPQEAAGIGPRARPRAPRSRRAPLRRGEARARASYSCLPPPGLAHRTVSNVHAN